ncbi:MAG: UDP-glucose 4-epimerase GalE [Pseudomonadota bacterium]
MQFEEAMAERVLITGGAGYIGSHAAKALSRAGCVPVVYDDLRRGNRWAVRWGPLVDAPLENRDALIGAIRDHGVTAVMHLAAYAHISESMQDPSLYYRNNIAASLNLLDAMTTCGVDKLIVSSTCAVYGIPEALPITERTPTKPINPYGHSKLMLEEICRWYGAAHGINTVVLRYFNAVGADPDGEIGEWQPPTRRLLPSIVEAALGKRPHLVVNGDNYPTPDGTAIRDYVHVADIAEAHRLAYRQLCAGRGSALYNLGTGGGVSIRALIEAVTQAVGAAPSVTFGPRRPGDPPELVADCSHAGAALGFRPVRSAIADIARDTVAWYRVGLSRAQRTAAEE